MAEAQAGKNRDLAVVGLRQGVLAGSMLEWGGVGLVQVSWPQGRQSRVSQDTLKRMKTCALSGVCSKSWF